MGVVGPGAGPRAGAGPGAHDRQAAAMDAFQARVAIEAVQQGACVQQLAEMLQVSENQAAELMHVVQEGVLLLALLHKPCCCVMSCAKLGQWVCGMCLPYSACCIRLLCKPCGQLCQCDYCNTACVMAQRHDT